jgi:hypothetical protein
MRFKRTHKFDDTGQEKKTETYQREYSCQLVEKKT